MTMTAEEKLEHIRRFLKRQHADFVRLSGPMANHGMGTKCEQASFERAQSYSDVLYELAFIERDEVK